MRCSTSVELIVPSRITAASIAASFAANTPGCCSVARGASGTCARRRTHHAAARFSAASTGSIAPIPNAAGTVAAASAPARPANVPAAAIRPNDVFPVLGSVLSLMTSQNPGSEQRAERDGLQEQAPCGSLRQPREEPPFKQQQEGADDK